MLVMYKMENLKTCKSGLTGNVHLFLYREQYDYTCQPVLTCLFLSQQESPIREDGKVSILTSLPLAEKS